MMVMGVGLEGSKGGVAFGVFEGVGGEDGELGER